MKSLYIVLNLKRKLLCIVFSCLEIFSIKSSFIHRFYTKWIGQIFHDEYTLANVTSDDAVLHIGCGSLPTMSILAAKNAGAKIIAIDNDLQTVHRAQRYVRQQKLSDFITVEYGDGRNYQTGMFDLIFIALNVTPIDAVFCHLATTSKPSVRIVCRDFGNGVFRMLKTDEFSNIFMIKSILKHSMNNSLLIIRLNHFFRQ
jgi:2-polyprenyl-3-methyl-5-hydroxy-6-metoxy-1,4-benzoquinol methylase